MATLITLRQTTYWDFLNAEGATRIHFTGKKEFRAAEDEVSSVEVVSEHPLLIDYIEAHTSIYIAGKAHDPSAILGEVQDAVLTATSGWRTAEAYLNADASSAVLTNGYGMLFRGPKSLGRLVSAALSKAAIPHTELAAGSPPISVRVLLAGGNWVVAEEFHTERLPSDTSLERKRER